MQNELFPPVAIINLLPKMDWRIRKYHPPTLLGSYQQRLGFYTTTVVFCTNWKWLWWYPINQWHTKCCRLVSLSFLMTDPLIQIHWGLIIIFRMKQWTWIMFDGIIYIYIYYHPWHQMPHFERTHGTVSFFAVLAHILLGRYSCLSVKKCQNSKTRKIWHHNVTPKPNEHLAALPPQRSTCAAVYRPNLGPYPEETLFE